MKLNYSRIFILGLGFLGVSVIWAIYNVFVPVFLDQKFHLAPPTIALFMTFDNLTALLIQPPVGAWSDKLRTPIGRRMPFILVGAPLAAVAFGFLPLAPVLPLFVLCTSTLLVSMAVWRTPVMALVADVTPSPLRSQASGALSFMGGVGAIIAYFGGARLSEINPAFPFWLGSVLVLVAAVLLLLWVKEPKEYETEELKIDEVQPGFLASLRAVFEDPDKSMLFLLLSIFCFMVGYTAIEGFFTLYASHHLGLTAADSSRLLGQLSFIFVVFAVPSGAIGSRFGRRNTIMVGLAMMCALVMAVYAIPVPHLKRVLFELPLLGNISIASILFMLVGIAWALVIIHPLPMLSDMTDDSRLGTYTGLYYLFTSLAAIIGPNLYGLIVEMNGQDYNKVMLFSPLSLGLGLLLLFGVRRGEARASNIQALEVTSCPNGPLEEAL